MPRSRPANKQIRKENEFEALFLLSLLVLPRTRLVKHMIDSENGRVSILISRNILLKYYVSTRSIVIGVRRA